MWCDNYCVTIESCYIYILENLEFYFQLLFHYDKALVEGVFLLVDYKWSRGNVNRLRTFSQKNCTYQLFLYLHICSLITFQWVSSTKWNPFMCTQYRCVFTPTKDWKWIGFKTLLIMDSLFFKAKQFFLMFWHDIWNTRNSKIKLL